MILVTGFGPFLDVADNPSAALARALHGRVAAGHGIHGAVLPVRWHEGPRAAIEAGRQARADLAIGLGVARGRRGLWIERTAAPHRTGADVDGVEGASLPAWRAPRRATLDPEGLARHLDARVSDDAGHYLCNAWLYEVPSALGVPGVFIHLGEDLPRHRGGAPDAFLAGLDAALREMGYALSDGGS